MLTSKLGYKKTNEFNVIEKNTEKSTEQVLVKDVIVNSQSIYIVRPTKDGFYPGIIFLHWLEPHAENSNRTEFLSLAIELAENHNISSILPDAFWSTTPEKYKKNPNLGWNTTYENDSKLILNQLKNILIIIDFFKSQSFVDSEKLFFCGHDFGAMFGCLLGEFKNNIRGYVLMALTSKFSDWFRFGNSLTTVEEFIDYCAKMSVYDPETNIRTINSEIFFQFALNDFYVPIENALALIAEVEGKSLTKWYKTNHGMNNEAFEDATNWLLEKISKL